MSPHATTQGATAGGQGGKPPKHWLMGTEAFERRMPHHDGIEALWETKWKFPCSQSLYPFHDGIYEDFEPIFEELIKNRINDATSPAYTATFFHTARHLIDHADSAVTTGHTAHASELYLRACAVLRIARFPYITSMPYINDALKFQAWREQKITYLKAGALWECGVEEVMVGFTHRKEGEGGEIPVYVRVPKAGVTTTREGKSPVVVLMTGLDGYRPDNTVRCEEFLARGWASVVVEIPGTADCPADSADPGSPDRLWTSLLEWMGQDGRFDMNRGAGCHHFYDPEWLERADGHEYPFKLNPAMAMKHGFSSVTEYKANAQKKFSLLEAGILKKPATRLLLINGTLDGLMPIEDSMMLFEHGTPKEARFFTGALHMGYPMANEAVYPWMEEVMDSVAD